MRPVTVTVGPLATASANNIALSQTPTSSFTLNGSLVSGGVATLDTPRRILFTNAGNESSNAFTITGTNASGMYQIEVLAGTIAGSFYNNLDFSTVSSIVLKNAASGAITVGTNGVASSPWVRTDEFANTQTGIQATVTGTVNYTIQSTYNDPNSPTNPIAPYAVTWVNTPDTNAVNATTSIQSYYAYTPTWIKVTLNSGTGSVTSTITQYGVAPY